MAIRASADAPRDLTIFRVEGELTYDEQMAVLRAFYSGRPTPNVIWDFRAIEGNRVSSRELEEIISFIRINSEKRPAGKTGLITATDLDFGMARMAEAHAEAEPLPWRIQAFRSMEEALAWIDEGRSR